MMNRNIQAHVRKKLTVPYIHSQIKNKNAVDTVKKSKNKNNICVKIAIHYINRVSTYRTGYPPPPPSGVHTPEGSSLPLGDVFSPVADRRELFFISSRTPTPLPPQPQPPSPHTSSYHSPTILSRFLKCKFYFKKQHLKIIFEPELK